MSDVIIPPRILKCHQDWARSAKQTQFALLAFGFCAVTSSVCVAVFTEELGILGTRIVGAIAALSVSYISAFQLQKKLGDLWGGWKLLNTALALYEQGKIDDSQLISEYARAEQLIGVPEVNTDSLTPQSIN
ncbi:MAG: hypothetical protein IPL03_12280 [Sterolibacteriaceae bacterium]|nr:hypothetical protein [Candidatus Methylophosphatis haderslevensis]